MKKNLCVLATCMILLLSGCNNQKVKSLETEIVQLKQQVDSLTIQLEEQKKIAEAYIDTARVLKYIAIAQTDSATRFKLMAAEALEQVKELKKKLEEK